LEVLACTGLEPEALAALRLSEWFPALSKVKGMDC